MVIDAFLRGSAWLGAVLLYCSGATIMLVPAILFLAGLSLLIGPPVILELLVIGLRQVRRRIGRVLGPERGDRSARDCRPPR